MVNSVTLPWNLCFDFRLALVIIKSMRKMRLDVLLTQLGLTESREKAKALIIAAQVLVNGQVVSKPGSQVAVDSEISLKDSLPYVSRGGLKLERALQAFNVDVQGKIVADVGASTGGFTDCLLKRGAAKVYAIDVGYGQLAWTLRQDARVVVMERTNVRYLQGLPELADLATVDVSFISLTLVLPAVCKLLKPEGEIIALIKPQFEAGRRQVSKGGVVKDAAVHRAVLQRIVLWSLEQGLDVKGLIPSPLRGPAGNIEFFIHLRRDGEGAHGNSAEMIERCLVLAQDIAS